MADDIDDSSSMSNINKGDDLITSNAVKTEIIDITGDSQEGGGHNTVGALNVEADAAVNVSNDGMEKDTGSPKTNRDNDSTVHLNHITEKNESKGKNESNGGKEDSISPHSNTTNKDVNTSCEKDVATDHSASSLIEGKACLLSPRTNVNESNKNTDNSSLTKGKECLLSPRTNVSKSNNSSLAQGKECLLSPRTNNNDVGSNMNASNSTSSLTQGKECLLSPRTNNNAVGSMMDQVNSMSSLTEGKDCSLRKSEKADKDKVETNTDKENDSIDQKSNNNNTDNMATVEGDHTTENSYTSLIEGKECYVSLRKIRVDKNGDHGEVNISESSNGIGLKEGKKCLLHPRTSNIDSVISDHDYERPNRNKRAQSQKDDSDADSAKKRRCHKKCIVPSCGIMSLDVSYFSFPKDKLIRKAWIHASRRRKEDFNPDTSYFCSKHFSEDQIQVDPFIKLLGESRYTRPKRLKPGSIPKLNLSNDTAKNEKLLETQRKREERIKRREFEAFKAKYIEAVLSGKEPGEPRSKDVGTQVGMEDPEPITVKNLRAEIRELKKKHLQQLRELRAKLKIQKELAKKPKMRNKGTDTAEGPDTPKKKKKKKKKKTSEAKSDENKKDAKKNDGKKKEDTKKKGGSKKKDNAKRMEETNEKDDENQQLLSETTKAVATITSSTSTPFLTFSENLDPDLSPYEEYVILLDDNNVQYVP